MYQPVRAIILSSLLHYINVLLRLFFCTNIRRHFVPASEQASSVVASASYFLTVSSRARQFPGLDLALWMMKMK